MLHQVLKSKIHEGTVTAVEVECEGSVAIDVDLMAQADLTAYEKVLVADCNNFNRFETYVVPAPAGSGEIKILGATAPLSGKGHKVNILAFGCLHENEYFDQPIVLRMDEGNRPHEDCDSLQQE